MTISRPLGRLVIASHNPGKVREIGELLAPFGMEVISAGDLGLPEPEETGATFQANAELKARAAAEGSGLTALADDSGVVVAALDGQPGIYSARWAGPDKDFNVAMARVEEQLKRKAAAGNPDRSAAFVCVLCLATPEGETVCFEGRVDGTMVWPPRGAHGFGYDPMFVPEGETQTFGEIEPATKHGMSHRARAFEKLVAEVFTDRP